MPENPLISCRVKIDRSYKHLADFQDAHEAFGRRNPNAIFTDEDSEAAIKIDRFALREPIPLDFSAFIGDIAHNLMSALDSLALSLVKHANVVPITEEVMRKTYFPISWEPGFGSEDTQAFLKNIGPAAEKIIRDIEPYKRGRGDDLFRLRRLNIIDKHRAIVPVASDLIGVQFRLPGEDSPPLPPRPAARSPKFPLKYGDELARRTFNEPEYHAHAHFMLQIAFGEGQVFEGKSVIPTLGDLIGRVEGVIYTFAHDIFRIDEW